VLAALAPPWLQPWVLWLRGTLPAGRPAQAGTPGWRGALVTDPLGTQEHQARVRELEEAAEGLRRQLAEQRGQQASAAAGKVGARAMHAVRGCACSLSTGRAGRVDDPRPLQLGPARHAATHASRPLGPHCLPVFHGGMRRPLASARPQREAGGAVAPQAEWTQRLAAAKAEADRLRGAADGMEARLAQRGAEAGAAEARATELQVRAPAARGPTLSVHPQLLSACGRSGASLCTCPPAGRSAARGGRRSGPRGLLGGLRPSGNEHATRPAPHSSCVGGLCLPTLHQERRQQAQGPRARCGGA